MFDYCFATYSVIPLGRFNLQHLIVNYVDSFLNIIYPKKSLGTDIMDLVIEIRNRARSEKNYALSDYIRKKLEEQNIYIEDNGDKTIWWIKN